MRLTSRSLAAACLVACALTAHAQERAKVRIAFIDPLSGPFANVGKNQLQSWQFMAEKKSGKANPAGVTFEIAGFDNKGSPQESLNALKAAIDQGFRYVTQGNGSGAAAAILDAINKHNERNPNDVVVYLNYAAVDPSLTNERCSYWHFRLDADTSMKMEALTSFMKDQPSVKRVFLINQNYAHGQQVARYFKEGLSRKRPDVLIVGDELHPLGQVKDFAPYAAKIKASGADTIVTGNWGADLTLFVKALNDAGMNLPIYAYYPGVSGTPTVLAQGGRLQVYQIANYHSNFGGEIGGLMAEFKKRYKDDFYTLSIYNGIVALGEAMAKSNSTNPAQVAAAMSGMSFKGANGESQFRKFDHQLQQGLWISRWQKTDAKYAYSVENTGYTFAPVKYIQSYIASTPTSCDMKRP